MTTTVVENALQTQGLSKRYNTTKIALSNCTISVPKGSITALVGLNGAGKTTLLELIVGLKTPTDGSATVLGQSIVPIVPIDRIGYVAQEVPLYGYLTVEDHITLGIRLNKTWDEQFARERLKALDIPLGSKTKSLSGGQRSQIALLLALAKKPDVLLLDEPVAALDPLAREEFLSLLTTIVAERNGELTVIMSSHLLVDLEHICDHLIVLAKGETQLNDSIETITEQHKLLIGTKDMNMSGPYVIVQETITKRQVNMLVRLKAAGDAIKRWHITEPTLEEIVLAYMRQSKRKGQQ